ncbi:hypothetical protein B0O99DRAFT_691824 [Bisporella sp. PMI_857]|nr:hypothetical protein B0O99DRAFT_691824 [Bisporella sp. PMI_857]
MVYLANVVAVVISIAGLQGVLSAPITEFDIEHSGDGCPQDASVSVRLEGNRIIANFGRFDVRSSPQSASHEACSLFLEIPGQPGKQFSPVSTSYHDYLEVDSGTTASHYMTYFFSENASAVSNSRHDFVGPTRGDFLITDSPTDRIWSRCGGSSLLAITNRGAVTGQDNSGRLYFNTGDAVTTLEWRSC